jgi:hypothetical protein
VYSCEILVTAPNCEKSGLIHLPLLLLKVPRSPHQPTEPSLTPTVPRISGPWIGCGRARDYTPRHGPPAAAGSASRCVPYVSVHLQGSATHYLGWCSGTRVSREASIRGGLRTSADTVYYGRPLRTPTRTRSTYGNQVSHRLDLGSNSE